MASDPAARRAAPPRVRKVAGEGVGKTAGASVRRPNLGPMGRLEDFIPYKMSVVANRVSQSIGRLFEETFNLQIPEWRILMALYAYGDLVFAEVVARTSMDKARVSRAHRRLVDLGMIEPVDDPADARKLILSLTAKGRKMCTAILPEAVARETWLLAALEPQEQRQLDVILDKLMRRTMEF